MNQHDCTLNLEFREVEWIESHGLDWGGEPCHEEWWECQVCGELFSEKELRKLNERKLREAA